MNLARAGCVTLALAMVAGGLAGSAAASHSPAGEDVFAFVDEADIDLRVAYADGMATTKFGFNQFSGERNDADERLSPGAECTEWVGRFNQVAVQARPQDNVDSVELTMSGYEATLAPDADPTRDEQGWTFEALGAPGAFDGTLLVCDRPNGNGVIDFDAELAGTLGSGPMDGIVRLEEA